MASSPINHTEQTPLLENQPLPATTDSENSSTRSRTNGEAVAVNEPSTVYLLKATSGIFLGIVVAAIDSSMIATISAPISSTFGSLSRLPWLISAFFVANAAIQPLSGKLTDIYGRKSGLIISNVVFAFGNLMCALAKTEWLLILGRFVGGLGGGGIAAGIGNVFFGTGSGLGGVIGGDLNDAFGWRAAFWVQIPATILTVILILLTVNIPLADTGDTKKSKIRKVDFPGAITLFTALTLILLALSSGGSTVPWNHPLVLVSLPLSIVSLVAFILIELKVATQPIIPVYLLWNRSIAAACLTTFFSSMSRFALLFYLPVYLQVQGYSPRETGLRLVPGSFAVAFASLTSGILVRRTGRYYKIGVFTQIIYLIDISATASFTLHTPAWIPFITFFAANFGYGAMLTTTILAILVAVEQKQQAVLTSAMFVFRSTGTVLGITLSGLTFQNVLRKKLWRVMGSMDDAEEQIRRIISDLRVIGEFPLHLREQILQAHMSALTAVFLVLVVMGGLAGIASLFIRDRVLPNKMSRSPRESNR